MDLQVLPRRPAVRHYGHDELGCGSRGQRGHRDRLKAEREDCSHATGPSFSASDLSGIWAKAKPWFLDSPVSWALEPEYRMIMFMWSFGPYPNLEGCALNSEPTSVGYVLQPSSQSLNAKLPPSVLPSPQPAHTFTSGPLVRPPESGLACWLASLYCSLLRNSSSFHDKITI